PPLIEIGSGIYFRLPLAIGAVDLTPLELTRAYMVFPNRGHFLKEYIIEEVRIADGTILHKHQPAAPTDALSTDVADIMVEALRGVALFGTAKSTLSKLEQPVAGKTGTTNHYSDAWFCGFTPDITSCVWVGGKDKSVSLGNRETGGRVAAPAFRDFVTQYYKGRSPVSFNIATEPDK
ncbi:MAG TPA: penicillin-binding transpeptidase domain-containing protein, partial [Patescibacteria group bacterium]|nr:penicillin-binding transpeptidase domain-containing protein [Patescibacteria group bacterium]